jgi:predicted dithiol-disulfide oxidoreductase (DUF899 family)
MTEHRIVSPEEWLATRQQLLVKEKELTRLRDELSRERRALPWERVDKTYVFAGDAGKETLAQLFAGRSQLVVYHFMYGPDVDVGCKSCSFWADGFNGVIAHLNARDVSLAAISRAPLQKLRAQAQRLGWSFKWVSSAGSDFNFDYQVSFPPEVLAGREAVYNYARQKISTADRPGVSVFFKDDEGSIFHTYSCYARGLDILNPAYHYLDLVPKGRDEEGLPYPMAWVKLHDLYGT